MNQSSKFAKIYHIAEKYLFPLVLFLYPLRHICYGVEWWDTGYNYGNFMFLDKMDPMWMFGTYLANVIGNFFTKLPFGNTMLGLNIYTGLVVSLMAVVMYFFFIKTVKLSSALTFLGEIIAIGLCWCPTALLYNYLTYLLMLGGMVCLYIALTKEKNGWFVAAGVFLGLNVFVRFSNLAQMAFILAVWAYAIIKKKKISVVFKETGLCILGYVIGIGLPLLYISLRYGLTEYVESVLRLFEMSSYATDYTIYAMLIYQLQNFWQNFIWLGHLVPFVLLGVLGFAVLPGKWQRLKKVGFVFCVPLVFYYLMNQNMFNMKYSTKLSVFQWAVMLLSFIMITGVLLIFSPKEKPHIKLLCGLSMLAIVITPLGSNNHLYSSINNLFFGAPVALYALRLCLKRLPEKWSLWKGRLQLYTYPVKAMVCMILLMLLVQSIGFGFGYVFSESDGGENLHTPVTGNPVLKGMYTSSDRAKVLEELYTYVQQSGLADKEVLLYGKIPALSFYLDMPFAISAWPDLPSYTLEVMEQDMWALEERISDGESCPAVLLESGCSIAVGEGELSEKEQLIADFMEKYGYGKAFENEKFVLYVVEGA